MTTALSTPEKQAFEQLLAAWNNQQDLRIAHAPLDARVTSLQHVGQARTHLHALRRAA